MTTHQAPIAVGNLAAAKVRNHSIATAGIHHALPRPRGLGVIALSPVAEVGRLHASPRQRAPGPGRAAGPFGHGGDRGRGPALLPDLPPLGVWLATPTSAITRTDLTDLTRLSLHPST
jgi:hypothetical protein